MNRKLIACVAVATLTSFALAEEIELTSGEILRAQLIEQGSDYVVVDHPLLGVLSIDRANVVVVRTDKDAKVPLPVVDTSKAGPPAAGGAPAAKKAPEWKFAAEFGLTGSSGNSDTLNLHVGISGKKKTEQYRWKWLGNWDKSRDDGTTTKDEKAVATQFDYFLKDSKFFPFARATYNTDEFQDYSHRVSVGAGVGYEVHKDETLTVNARLGGNAVREFKGMDDSWRAEALIGGDAEWEINDTQDFEIHSTYFPDLEESGEYRWVTIAAWAVTLDEESNMKLKIGIENERDSHREDPFDDNDFKYFVALLFEF